MNVLFVPTLGLDVTLLDRLANSVDHHVQYKVAYNNGVAGALDGFGERHRDWIVKDAGYNKGVAGSWNECAKWFSTEPCWLIMNEDAWFLPGYLKKICETADANLNAPMIHLNSSNAYYCFVWTAAGKRDHGDFDENFWPAYYEDCDMRVRHRKWGINTYPYALEGLEPLPHGKPQTGGMNYNAMLQGTGLLNRAYWLKKWGSFDFENGHYVNPCRDSRIPPHQWVWYPEERKMREPIFDAFMAMPNVSLYT